MSGESCKDIAIIGMACVFPGAENLQRYWENIIAGVDAVSDPPPDWEAELFFDPQSDANDRIYCKRGGFLGKLAQFDPFTLGVMPSAVDGAETDHFMALRAAHEALADAGYRDASKVKHRTAVILGRGTYINRGNAAALQQGVIIDSVLRILKQLHPEHTDEELAEIKRRLKESAPAFHADTAPGLVPNIISGRIANRLDLMGPNYLIDAACASSLVATEMAARELRDGRCDLALAGGVHSNTSPVLMMIFSQLNALSRSGQIRPFSHDADGTLLGEGVGVVVLKRLADAERDGNHIYAVLKGVGIASDGRAMGVLAPRVEGEETALRRAYEEAGVDPATIGLLEAHGTGTPVGDAVEIEASRRVFPPRRTESPRCALGSVKSMISHTMPAAGMAGLIKAALALHHKVLPPTLHCDHPNPKLGLEETNFYINTKTRPWIHGSTQAPRRAGVNAFGFGGINAHAVLEEYTGNNRPPSLQHRWDSELFVVSASSSGELAGEAQRLLDLSNRAGEEPLKDLAWSWNCRAEWGPVRLAIVATSVEDLRAKLERTIPRLGDERTRGIKEIEGIYYFREGLAREGKVAFVFPGEGSQYRSMFSDLCIHFPEVRRMFDLMDRAYERRSRNYLPSDVIFPPPLGSPSQDRIWNMDSGAETVFCANQAAYALIRKLGIDADAMVGHSTGEHSALLASKVVLVDDDEELIRHILGVYDVFERLNADSGIPEAVLLAVAGADHALLEQQVAAGGGDLHIALDNCIHQVVLCGKEAAIDRLTASLAGSPAICQKLPFGRAYHTPWFEVFSKPLQQHFERLRIGKPRVDLYSCVTAGRYPEDPAAIRELASVQWSRTVRFRETIEAMYRDGIRVFVEVGPRNNLTSFIDDVLRGKRHAAIPMNVQHRTGILQLHHMLGQLIAHGLTPRLEYLYEQRAPKPVGEAPKPKRVLTLATGIQPLRLPHDFKLPGRKQAAAPPSAPASAELGESQAPKEAPAPALRQDGAAPAPSPREQVMRAHLETMDRFLATQKQVMSTYLAARRQASRAPRPGQAAGPQFPFLTEIVKVEPGVSAVVIHRFSAARDVIFHHHTMGRDLSVEDPVLVGLPFVPLTVTMEILAEAGSLLEPGKVLVGMRELRAARWITLERPDYTIQMTARRKGPGEVHVRIQEAGPADKPRPILAEAAVLFARTFPDPGPPRPFVLEEKRPSRWTPDMLYRTGMFHGPLMQGTRSVEWVGRNGTSATIEALPHDALFAGRPAPRFLFDPVLLDAAGQVVAYWFWEAVETGTDLFPYRVGAFHCYSPAPETGAKLECRVVRKHQDEKVIHSDIEVLDRSGRVYYRLENWETRRFRQPPRFLHLRVAPKEAYVSEPWDAPIAAIEDKSGLACVKLADLTPEFLESSHGIWLKTLAYLVLSRREREVWEAMHGAVVKRRREWLLGRCAAKDAVRMLLKKRLGLELCAADVEIVEQASGRPVVEGAWKAKAGVQPAVSISHSHGVAAALAALEPDRLLGIDIEFLGRSPSPYETAAFSEEERSWIDSFGTERREEWSLRLWCAKEAAAKALGKDLSSVVSGFRVAGAEHDAGRVRLISDNGLLDNVPGKTILAYTQREGDLISSSVVYPAGARR